MFWAFKLSFDVDILAVLGLAIVWATFSKIWVNFFDSFDHSAYNAYKQQYQHNDNHHNDNQHNDSQHTDTQHYISNHPVSLCLVLYVTCHIFIVILTVVMLNVVMLSVVVPIKAQYHERDL